MGHIHLGRLPGSRPWKAVVALLDDGAADETVIAQAARAAERELSSAAEDPVFVEAVRLLAMIPLAAKSRNFGRALRAMDVAIGDAPDLTDLLLAVSRRLDRQAAEAGRSDFGELSRRALIATLSSTLGGMLPGLLDPEAGDVRAAAARAGRSSEFAAMARHFFGRLVTETLSSWLDRTLSTRVGPDRRFAHAGERADFDAALEQYGAEATRIIREFAVGWRERTLQRDGAISRERAAAFGAVAFRKIGEELRAKRGADD